jgi:hypothetical protein
MLTEALIFGGHILELAGGHYLAEKLDKAIRSALPERNHDLEHAVGAAFEHTTDNLALASRTD